MRLCSDNRNCRNRGHRRNLDMDGTVALKRARARRSDQSWRSSGVRGSDNSVRVRRADRYTAVRRSNWSVRGRGVRQFKGM